VTTTTQTPGRPVGSSTVDEHREGPAGPAFTLVVFGRPAPQGSKRHVGRGIMVESSKHVRPWRDAVRGEAQAWTAAGHVPLDGPLRVEMVFTLPKPASAPKRRRTWPDRTPDLSKLCRSTEDALKDAGVIADDARIVEYSRLAKVYPREDPAALAAPGVALFIWRVEDEGANHG
jgi:Holliday junction resolvase RusA-like endonuclease